MNIAVRHLPNLVIPADVPDALRQVLAHFDAGYTRAAEIAGYDPAEMRRQAAGVREAGMEWAAERIEARARIVELDPRLELVGSAIAQLDAKRADTTLLVNLRLYCDLVQAQAEARRDRRAAA